MMSVRALILSLVVAGGLATGAIAHTVKVAGEVAATFHLDPDHNPKAGRPARVWFALTQKGGRSIPLDQCQCSLSVYVLPRSSQSRPISQPPLRSLSVETYREIPAADVVFPYAGAYELELTGSALNGASFRPFTVKYQVTVSR